MDKKVNNYIRRRESAIIATNCELENNADCNSRKRRKRIDLVLVHLILLNLDFELDLYPLSHLHLRQLSGFAVELEKTPDAQYSHSRCPG